MNKTKQQSNDVVKTKTLGAPKLTRWGVAYLLVYIGTPIIGVLFALDVALYCYFKFVLGRCYGILCLF